MTARWAQLPPELRVRSEPLAAIFAIFFAPWTIAVRLPAVAFVLGAIAATSSPRWLILALFIVFVINTSPGVGILVPLIAVPLYIWGSHAWLACLLAVLGWSAYVETNAHFAQTKRQAELLLSDILSETSKYVIREIPVPDDIKHAFWSYQLKERRNRWAAAYNKKLNLPQIITYENPSVIRAFQFAPIDGKAVVGSAVAFPFDRYASLIFVRHGFESLSDAQRLQLFHELAHGTPEGREVILRPIRWQSAAYISAITTLLFWLITTILLVRHPSSPKLWVALAASVIANLIRFLCVTHVNRIATAASEVLADSMSLTRSEFLVDDRWMLRATNLAKRLESELSLLNPDDPRWFEVRFRIGWIRRWLSLGGIPVYHGADVDPRIFLALVLYAVAGFCCNPVTLIPWIFWISAPLAFLSFQGVTGRNAMKTDLMLREIDRRISERLRIAQQMRQSAIPA
jgi:hypothetical protein